MAYDSKKRSADSNKIEANKILKKLATEYSGLVEAEELSALILDTSEFLTTNALKLTGLYKKKNIEIPQIDQKEYRKMIKKHRFTYNLPLGEYLDSLKELSDEDLPVFSIAFFDYCCSVFGNDKMSPESDIKKYFEMELPANMSIFGYTFSFRTKKGEKYESVIKADNIITSAAYENGYNAVKLPYGKVYNGMFYGFYVIYKQITFLP
jgi:hypothetical protein